MLYYIKSFFKKEQSNFKDFCNNYELNLSFKDNWSTFGILQSVFRDREYSTYFPFYQKNIILDIGAHYGYFTIFAAKNSHAESTIYAIEPARQNFEILKKNCRDNKIENVYFFNFAMGDTDGKAKLFLSRSENNTLIENRASESKLFEHVELRTFESFLKDCNLPKVDFCKMDCEGAEYQIILQTPLDSLQKIRTFSIEFHDYKYIRYTVYDLLNKLQKAGFCIVKFEFAPTNQNKNYGRIVATRM